MTLRHPQHGLEWKYELFDVVPSWTVEPDIAIARAIALRHLPVIASGYGIRFFSAGTFNKLYSLYPLDNDEGTVESFIMRISLPVDPYFKTASEVATLQFVRKNTSIPVPHVIAFDSSSDNELGFEWILMGKLPGVSLKSLWESQALVWEERVQITKTLAGYVKQLMSFKFPLMGSLYPSTRREVERVAWLKDVSSKTRFVPLLDDAEFSMGPVVTIPFFYGDRVHLQPDRGPFETSLSYLTSLLHLHVTSTTSRKIAASADDEYDEDDISELDDAIAAYQSILSILPSFFPPEASSQETFSLYHDDMSSNNILIDPATHRITGIVDWECVSLQPAWHVARVPQLLDGPEVDDGSPIPAAAPPPDKGADDFHKELRDRLEQMLLRGVFYEELGGKPEHGSRERLFENKMYQAEVRPTGVRNWANKVQQGSDPFPTKTEGNPYFWPEH
ncbi:phosphotransferase enzyme family-domain-containing protein [Lactifluus subvellereus]|nr:phosphotransferase enzyme family-domain-containing protein [Lactifluus subvellereus]